MKISLDEFVKAIEDLKKDPQNEKARQIFMDYGIQEGFIHYEIYRIG